MCTACGSTPPRCAARGTSPTASASCARRPRSRSPAGSTTWTPPSATALVARMARDAASRGIVGLVDLDMAWNESAWARRLNRRVRRPPGRVRHLSGVPRPGDRRGAPHRRSRARRGIRPRACRIAQGHHRRLAGHAHGRLLARIPRRPAQPRRARRRPRHAARADDRRDRRRACRARSTRSATSRTRTRWTRSRSPARSARSSTRSWSRTPTSRDSRRLGVGASVQPEHAVDDRDLTDSIWAEQTRLPYPLRALADTGANLLFGSDAPVSPLDPWAAMAAAIFRTRDGRPAWRPEQRVDAATALAASTHGGSTAPALDRTGRARRPRPVRTRPRSRRRNPSCAR